MSFTACTIAARCQLAQARALAWSLRVLDPGVVLHVLVVDDSHRQIDGAREPFVLLSPDSLDLPRFEVLAGMHALSELVEVLRPAVLRSVLDMVRGPVVLLDVDMLAYHSLALLPEALKTHQIALVPRLLAAVPRDHVRLPDEGVIKRGVFDQGLVAVRASIEVDQFLRQWSDRVEVDRGDEIPLAAARFLDLAPTVLGTATVLRDPGLGVSTLNLHERPLTIGRIPLSGGRPLRLVHFTGLDGRPQAPRYPFSGPSDGGDVLAEDHRRSPEGLRERNQRELRGRHPELARLLAEHDRALARHGDAEARRDEYGYARLADGTPLGRRLRRMIRDAELYGGFRGSPFDKTGTVRLLEWLNAPGERGGRAGVTRYWFAIYRERPDLQAIHADLDGPGGAGFLRWQAELGHAEYATPPALVVAGFRD